MQADEPLFRVVLRFEVHEGMEQDFETTWQEIGASIAAASPIRNQWLLRGADEPRTYWIMSDWADEPTFRAFELGAPHVEHRKRLAPYRASVSMTTMRVACHLGGTATAGPEAAGAPAALR
jgi:heme-degrading monooxygenase HmoA